ncbi:putative proteasome subunit alpha type-2 [Claviceps sp. Clav32 group G5]|nr:putative proteasome subunit alpha type-2 [Claviceps sp. Clav32 group G5]
MAGASEVGQTGTPGVDWGKLFWAKLDAQLRRAWQSGRQDSRVKTNQLNRHNCATSSSSPSTPHYTPDSLSQPFSVTSVAMADRYSFSLTTFSPSGKLVQIEYALNAVNQGITALGIKATNGIVLATEKKSSSPLADQSTVSKISNITPNIGAVYSGMGPDYRVLVDRARKVSHTGYKRIYNEYPPTRILVQDVARVMQEATQSAGVRPYGVSMLIAGWDDGIEPDDEAAAVESGEKKPNTKTGGIHKGGPMLYQVDPTGSYFPWKATAIGKSATKAKTFLEKRYSEELELEDAIHIALLTLKDNIEGEMNGDSIEIGIVGPPAEHLLGLEGVEGAVGPRFRKLTPQEIEDYLTSL